MISDDANGPSGDPPKPGNREGLPVDAGETVIKTSFLGSFGARTPPLKGSRSPKRGHRAVSVFRLFSGSKGSRVVIAKELRNANCHCAHQFAAEKLMSELTLLLLCGAVTTP